MAPARSNGQRRAVLDETHEPEASRTPRPTPRTLTPDDVVPRLIALGVTLEAADRLVAACPDARIIDALDALEELDAKRRVADPIRWVDAAITQRWDLSGLLAERRERETRLAASEADRRERERTRDAYPQRRAVADRWDAAISPALDDAQLTRAIEAVSAPVPGLGRRSVPVARAEILAWAIDAHSRYPERPLADALTTDLDVGVHGAALPEGELPEPPSAGDCDGTAEPLATRIRKALADIPELANQPPRAHEAESPDHGMRVGRDLEL